MKKFISIMFNCKECDAKIAYSSVKPNEEQLCSKCSGINVYKD